MDQELPSAEIVRLPLDPPGQLRASLRMLETRLAQQQASLAEWRKSLSQLATSLRELCLSVDICDGEIAAAGRAAATARPSDAESA